jgi:hypothetical protein
MAKRRDVKKGDEIVVDGPAVVLVQRGSATLIVRAQPTVKIDYRKRKARKNPLVR